MKYLTIKDLNINKMTEKQNNKIEALNITDTSEYLDELFKKVEKFLKIN